jgi:uncharacterized heparinase superfamily protein
LNPRLLFHTLAPLRWEQFVYRPLRVAQFRAYRTFSFLASRWQQTNTRGTPAASSFSATIRTVFENTFIHLHAESDWKMLRHNRFTFLNRTLELPDIDWNRRYESHLWNYQFHYFHHTLGAANALRRRGDAAPMQHNQRLIESWIAGAKIGYSDGWDAYPISLRVVNWIYAYALVSKAYDDRAFLQRWRTSIYQQLAFLHEHLEFHLLANHLLKNAKALVIGGLFFADDPRGQQWLATGERLLWREFEEQVLADGGHYERSPMYHALCFADFLECFALLREFKAQRGIAWEPQAYVTKLQAMGQFLAAMTYADGTLALFNDSGNSEEAHPLPLLETARRILDLDLQLLPASFPDTGYYQWRSADGQEQMIVDAGPPAVTYNLAHAHCDLLSYELRLDGQTFIVDSGVHGYGGDKFREYCRSTRAHNTVMFDGREQSEVWGTFRMGRTAKLLRVEVNQVNNKEQAWDLRGAYHPYYERALKHERRLQRLQNGEWRIEDRAIDGKVEWAQSFIHLHPNVTIKKNNNLSVECHLGRRTVLIEPFAATTVEIIRGQEAPLQGWYFPDFGIAQPSPTICFSYLVKEGIPFGYSIKG